MNNPLNALAGSRIVVTGAAGFIGTALVERLLAAGAHVVGIDIRQGCVANGYRHVTGDASRLTASELAELRPDYFFHLASIVGVVAASGDPEATREAILGMTRQFVELVSATPGVRFVYVSSSEVYGEAVTFPIVESTALAPLSAYGQSKRDAERVVLDATASGNLDAVIIRPFNVYGPGQRPDFVTSRFIELALDDKDLTLVGGGRQVRTFTYIDDFVEGLLRAAVHDGDERVFNISGPETATIGELGATIIDVAQSDASLVSVDTTDLGRPADIEVRDRVASHELARERLGYQPTIGVREGVARMIAAAREKRLVAQP